MKVRKQKFQTTQAIKAKHIYAINSLIVVKTFSTISLDEKLSVFHVKHSIKKILCPTGCHLDFLGFTSQNVPFTEEQSPWHN